MDLVPLTVTVREHNKLHYYIHIHTQEIRILRLVWLGGRNMLWAVMECISDWIISNVCFCNKDAANDRLKLKCNNRSIWKNSHLLSQQWTHAFIHYFLLIAGCCGHTLCILPRARCVPRLELEMEDGGLNVAGYLGNQPYIWARNACKRAQHPLTRHSHQHITVCL